jgi:regulatory protein
MDTLDKFYERTLRFLSFRPRSEKEIRDYLKKKNSDDLTSKKIIEKLKEHKFLNDEEFAKWWIEQRTRVKPRADRVIKFELKQKGIDPFIIEELIGDNEKSDFDKAFALAEKRMKRLEKIEDKKIVFEKLGRFLASKGFNYDIIKEVIDRTFSKEYNNSR